MSDTDVPVDLSIPLDVYLRLLDAARDWDEEPDDVAVAVLEEWAYAYRSPATGTGAACAPEGGDGA